MSISSYRASEPLYLVIVREKNAEQMLREWAKSANVQVTIESTKMKIFDQRSFSSFQMTWKNDWRNVLIWDYWNRRHIEIQ